MVKKDELINLINEMLNIVWHGCSNRSCVYNDKTGGMKTNMICKCERELKRLAYILKGMLDYE